MASNSIKLGSRQGLAAGVRFSTKALAIGLVLGLAGCGGGGGGGGSSATTSSTPTAAATASTATTTTTPTTTTSSTASTGGVTALRAADFVNSVGVGVHMGQTGTGANTYGNLPGTISALSYLGVKHVRDSIGGAFSPYFDPNGAMVVDPTAKLQQFAAIGVTFDLILNGDPLTLYTAADAKFASHIDSLEGPNEPEISPCVYGALSSWAACAALQQAVFTLAKTAPELAQKPVINMALQTASDSAQVGNVGAFVDYNNVHVYPGHGHAPYTAIPQTIAATTDAPGKPFIVTETGYSTYDVAGPVRGSVSTTWSQWIPEDIQAKYLTSAVLDDFSQGIVKTYLYELYDEASDPNNVNPGMHNGLYRFDGSAKPVASALHNLLSIIGDTTSKATSFSPSPLAFTVTQSLNLAAPVFQTCLLQKANGVYELVIWQEPTLWIDSSNVEQPAQTNFVTVTLPSNFSTINTYDIMSGVSPTATVKSAKTVTVQVVDHAMVVELIP